MPPRELKGNSGRRKKAHILSRINQLRKKLRIPKRPKPGELPEVVAKNSSRVVHLLFFGSHEAAQHKCFKFTYTLVTVVMSWALASLDQSWLYDPHPQGGDATASADQATFWLVVVATLCAYFAVQGTDAGYIRKEDVEQEGRGLLGGEGDDRPEDLRAPIPVTVDVIEPHMRSEPAPDATSLPEGPAGAAGAGAAAEAESLEGGRTGDSALLIDGRPVSAPPRKCEDCDMVMPLRAKHCRQCNMCVSMYDHHCGVIGTCIGERNHCRFWWFLFFQLLELLVGASVAHSGVIYMSTYSDWMGTNSLAFFCLCVIYIWLIVVLPLFIFHTWLACTNTTSYETAKGADGVWYYAPGTRECDLPFSRGVFANLRAFCCVRDGMWEILGKRWSPSTWKPPGAINHDSDDIFENPWTNKYYSCC